MPATEVAETNLNTAADLAALGIDPATVADNSLDLSKTVDGLRFI